MLRGLRHGDGQRTDDVSESAESDRHSMISEVDSSGETFFGEEVEYMEPGGQPRGHSKTTQTLDIVVHESYRGLFLHHC